MNKRDFKPGDRVQRRPFYLEGDLTLKLKWGSKSAPHPGVKRHPGGEYFYVKLGEVATVETYRPSDDTLWVEGCGVALAGRTFRKVGV